MWAVLLVLFTVLLIIWRPFGLGAARAATLGAVIALLTGLVKVSDLAALWSATWNATLTLVSLITLSLLLDAAGFFRWLALHVARWGQGQGARLLVLLILFSGLVSAVFANDGGVLILTPIVLELAQLLELDRKASLALALAVGFVVDAASLPLTMSNLTNIIAADAFHLSFTDYARVMIPVDLAVVLACTVVLSVLNAHFLLRRYTLDKLPTPASAVRSWGVFRTGWLVTPLLLAGGFLAARLHLPLSVVVGGGALTVWLAACRSQHLSSRQILRSAPWNVVAFSLAMYTVVYSLRYAGITALYGEWLKGWASHGPLPAILASGLSVAGLSATLNNLPALLSALLGIEQSGVGGQARDTLLYGAIVGADIGSKLTPIGSLATLLWLHLLRARNLHVGWGEYLLTGLRLTPPVLLVGLLTLWLIMR